MWLVFSAVSPVNEHVSGNTVEFEMGSLVPATHYTVGVYAMRDAQKSASATTEFTTGEPHRKSFMSLPVGFLKAQAFSRTLL